MNASIKMVLCAVVLGVSTVSLPGPVAAEECGGSSMAAQILKNHQDKLKALGCKNDPDCIAKRIEIFNDGMKFWNSMAGNSWATLGPRELTLGQELKGTAQNPGERRFVSPLPIIDHDTVKITLTKTGGQAETDVKISRLDAQGNCADLVNVTVPKGTGNFAQTFTLPAVRGSVLTVRLTPKGLGRKLEYTLLAKGQ